MKIIVTIICLIMTTLFSFAQSFEGVIEATTFTKATKENATVKWYVKDGSSRMEITGTADGKATATTLLFTKGSKNLNIISDMGGQPAVFTVPQDSIKTAANANVLAVKMDSKKTIAGYGAYLVKLQSPESISECWVSDEVKIATENLPQSLVSKGIIAALRSNGFTAIPLDVVTKDNTGEVQYSFSVKNITPMTLPAAQFQLPANAVNGEEALKKSMKAE